MFAVSFGAISKPNDSSNSWNKNKRISGIDLEGSTGGSLFKENRKLADEEELVNKLAGQLFIKSNIHRYQEHSLLEC